jgi:hypothetical protein
MVSFKVAQHDLGLIQMHVRKTKQKPRQYVSLSPTNIEHETPRNNPVYKKRVQK